MSAQPMTPFELGQRDAQNDVPLTDAQSTRVAVLLSLASEKAR
ncbi:hypothetical protein [Agromyces sp. ZXT2-3]